MAGNAGYSKVLNAADEPTPERSCIEIFFAGGVERTDSTKHDDFPEVLTFVFHPEAWRQVSYVFFWLMCLFATLLTDTLVDREGLGLGKNFETTHLVKTFGYNNVRSKCGQKHANDIAKPAPWIFSRFLSLWVSIDMHELGLHS